VKVVRGLNMSKIEVTKAVFPKPLTDLLLDGESKPYRIKDVSPFNPPWRKTPNVKADKLIKLRLSPN
jgi:hypothetical protein